MSTEELWFWKVEPCSPPLDTDPASEWSLHEDDDWEPSGLAEDPVAVVPSRASRAQQLLDDIEEYVKKEEESFSEWFEEKVQLPNFDDIQTVLPVEPLHLASLPAAVPFKADDDLSYVLGHGHLTPPQSPPASETAVQQIYVIQEQPSYVTLLPTQPQYIPEPFELPQTSGDLEREMAVVDEVVRGVAEQWQEALESTDSSSRSSLSTEDSDDPEWMPLEAPVKTTRRPRQGRPYSVEDRRQRKKEQNKNAATRYRQKKKAEVNVVVEEERELEDKNALLEVKVTDLTREIKYLKGLMRDMFKAKGLLK